MLKGRGAWLFNGAAIDTPLTPPLAVITRHLVADITHPKATQTQLF